MLKSRNPPPKPFYPGDLDLPAQALKARRELYPMTFFYIPLAFAALLWALRTPATRVSGLCFFGAGLALWTLVEYLVHRFVLHPPFPDGSRFWEHALHNLIAQRDAYLTAAQPGYTQTVDQHPIWHTVYAGLGFRKNPYVAGYSDEVAAEAVYAISPSTPYLSAEYERRGSTIPPGSRRSACWGS
jgi:hypothetical protein